MLTVYNGKAGSLRNVAYRFHPSDRGFDRLRRSFSAQHKRQENENYYVPIGRSYEKDVKKICKEAKEHEFYNKNISYLLKMTIFVLVYHLELANGTPLITTFVNWEVKNHFQFFRVDDKHHKAY